jgi:Protein of unknown function (DUF4239)
MYWVYDIPNWLFGALTVTVFVLVSLTGLFATHAIAKWLPSERRHGNKSETNGFVSTFFGASVGLYGITLGLISVGAWQNFSDVDSKSGAEAASVSALYRDVAAYPEPVRTTLRAAVKEYTRCVIEDAWPLQRKGIVPDADTKRIDMIQVALHGFEPKPQGEGIHHQEALTQFNKLVELRRRRLQTITSSLPASLWGVVLALHHGKPQATRSASLTVLCTHRPPRVSDGRHGQPLPGRVQCRPRRLRSSVRPPDVARTRALAINANNFAAICCASDWHYGRRPARFRGRVCNMHGYGLSVLKASLAVGSLVACGAGNHIPPAANVAPIVRFREASGEEARVAPAVRPVGLPELVSLSGYSLVFDREVVRSRVSTLSDQPVELTDTKVGVLSFGRRVVVTGPSALIVDREQNPMLRRYTMVPEFAGGGFIFATAKGLFYARTFEGKLEALALPDAMSDVESLTLLFGPKTLLLQDRLTLGSEDQDDLAEGSVYLSLKDRSALTLSVKNIRHIGGAADGRMVVLNKDGEVFFAESADKPLRKIDLPQALGLDSTGQGFNITDKLGVYALDPAQTNRASMPPALPAVFAGPRVFKSNWSTRALAGRLLDANTVVDISGTELTGFDLMGKQASVQGTLVKGLSDRSCQFVSHEGPLFFTCSWDKGISVHAFDLKTHTGTFEHAFPTKPDQSSATISAGSNGLPAARGKCDGNALSTSACVRTKAGTYKDLNFLPAMRSLGLVEPGAAAEEVRYVASNAVFAPGEDGTAALIVASAYRTSESAHLILSDGRTRSFSLLTLPRRVRALFSGSNSQITAWLYGDTVVGFLNGDPGLVRNKGSRCVQRMPKRKALSFIIGLTGDIKITEIDGFMGRSGSRIVRANEDGSSLLISTDLGRTFQAAAPPPGFLIDPAEIERTPQEFCADMGCRLGPWIRTGWPRAPQTKP